MSKNEQCPTLEQLSEIVHAVRGFAKVVIELGLVDDSPRVEGLEVDEVPIEFLSAIMRLDAAINLKRLPMGDPNRNGLGPCGWPDGLRLWRALRQAGELTECILRACGLDGLVTDSGVILSTTPPTECVPTNHRWFTIARPWPPKINESTLAGLLRACSWIADVVNSESIDPPVPEDLQVVLDIITEEPGITEKEIAFKLIDENASADDLEYRANSLKGKELRKLRNLHLIHNRKPGYHPGRAPSAH